jgi:hypothetical protein
VHVYLTYEERGGPPAAGVGSQGWVAFVVNNTVHGAVHQRNLLIRRFGFGKVRDGHFYAGSGTCRCSCSNFNDKLFVYHNYEECLLVNAVGRSDGSIIGFA